MSRSRKALWFLAVLVVGYIGYGSLPDAGEMLSGARAKDAERDVLLSQVALADEAILGADTFLAELDALRTAVPVDPDLPGVIADLDRAVRASGMRWSAGAPSPLDAGLLEGGTGQWRLAMTLSGGSDDLLAFLDEVARLERLVTVESLQVRGEGADFVAQIAVRFYALPGDPLAFDPDPIAASPTTAASSEG